MSFFGITTVSVTLDKSLGKVHAGCNVGDVRDLNEDKENDIIDRMLF